MITYEDFSKLDLRVGRILEVLEHPNANKLYILKVDIQEKVIQIVSGIKNFYKPQDLINKLIVVIVNLEPKEIRGVLSSGMLLAAQDIDKISLLTVDFPVNIGSQIK